MGLELRSHACGHVDRISGSKLPVQMARYVVRMQWRQKESGRRGGLGLGAAEAKEEASLRQTETLRDTHGRGER